MTYQPRISRFKLFPISMLAVCGLTAEVHAQDRKDIEDSSSSNNAFAGAGYIEEIMVTARRRSESLQDTPISITVLTNEDIVRGGVEGIDDIANLTPNVTFENSLNLGNNYLTIRGLSQAQYGPPPAAIVVDGVLQMSPLQFNLDEFDLEQVEVMKGPQGAIYGRNAIAGAINMTTVKPTEDVNAHALAGYARGNEWKGKASVSGPVVPNTLYMLAGVSYTDRRGQVRNVTTGSYADKFEDVTGRLRVVATPNDSLELDLKYTYSNTKGGDPAYVTSRSGDPSVSSDPLDANTVGNNPRELHDLSGKLIWDMGFATSTLTLAYVDVKESLWEDLDMLSIDFLSAEQHEAQEGFSQEIRLTSSPANDFRWIVGAYHVRLEAFRGATIFGDPFYFGLTPEPSGANTIFGSAADEEVNETWSGFGQLEYDINDKLTIDLSVRYDTDKLTQDSIGGSSRNVTFNEWQPKGTLSYSPGAEATMYVSVGKGFRSGVFNASGSTFGDPIARPEVATTYEIGAKTQLLKNRVRLSAAVYQTDLTDGQYTLFDGDAATNVRVNIDKSRIRGFELEGAFYVTEGVGVRASLGYTDPEMTDFDPPQGYPGTGEEYIGNKLPRAPDLTANLGLQFDFPLNDVLDIFFRPDYRYTGSYYWTPENNYKRPSYNTLNIRAGLGDKNRRWTVTAYVKNLLDEKITSDYQPFSTTGLPTGNDVYSAPIGSIYGVDFHYQF